ncbi:MAG: Hsp20/alpha crystallin family protein [Deltaproteobacteria bacterium]|nr:Hsp20/alpha crystallin family protein [Deltaproteobacteria bacterium]
MASKSTDITRKEQEGLTARSSDKQRVAPAVDVFENRDEILVLADLPGVTKEHLTIRMEDSELLIQGTQADAPDPSTWRAVDFYRTFRVPNTVNPEKISAELKNGVLSLKLKKREEAKPKQIEVKVI